MALFRDKPREIIKRPRPEKKSTTKYPLIFFFDQTPEKLFFLIVTKLMSGIKMCDFFFRYAKPRNWNREARTGSCSKKLKQVNN